MRSWFPPDKASLLTQILKKLYVGFTCSGVKVKVLFAMVNARFGIFEI